MLINIFLPLFNFLLISIGGRFFGKIGIIYLTIYNLLLTLFFNCKILYSILLLNTSYFVSVGTWVNVALLTVKWEFLLDFLALAMLVLVSLISILVHIYSFAYMQTDPHFIRFISYLSLFTFFMFILVTGSNFIQIFVGWEGVGICSYLLINFWFTRIQANKAAIKALLMNRLGDIGLIFAIVSVFTIFKTLDFSVLYTLAPVYFETFPIFFYTPYFVLNIYDVVGFFIIIAVVGKSAQLGLHTWLPSAMEGPTPVSALIHAATMVTAGVFLLIRVSFLFECSPNMQSLLLIIAVLTALFSAVTAIFLYDIKRIIAYSTCSQLGYMVVACTLSQYHIAFFHILNHAFFKALLFLTAGAIIHSFNNEQDIRKLGNLFFQMPFIVSCILIGNIAIMGLPFLSGFYSKDLIIELLYLNGGGVFYLLKFNVIYILILLATFCTSMYSLRLYYFLFLRQYLNKYATTQGKPITQPLFIKIVLVILMVGSIFVGYLLSDLFSVNNKVFKYNSTNFLSLIINEMYFENEFLPFYIKIAPLFCNIIGVVCCSIFLIYYNTRDSIQIISFLIYDIFKTNFYLKKYAIFFYLTMYSKGLIKLFQNNFYFNEFYNYVALLNFHYYYTHIFLNIDKGILELIGPTGGFRLYNFCVNLFQKFYKQTLTKHFFLIYNTILCYFFLVEYFM